MYSSAKSTYISIQSRLMLFAIFLLFAISVSIMALEAYNLIDDDTRIAQIITLLSIFLGILFYLVGMLIVEIVFQDDIGQFPIISNLGRLTPELTRIERFTLLNMILRRQLIIIVPILSVWVMIGNTHRSAPIVISMTLITVFTIFGIYYVRGLLLPDEVSAIDVEGRQ